MLIKTALLHFVLLTGRSVILMDDSELYNHIKSRGEYLSKKQQIINEKVKHALELCHTCKSVLDVNEINMLKEKYDTLFQEMTSYYELLIYPTAPVISELRQEVEAGTNFQDEIRNDINNCEI